jgi:hypothetical protein
MQAIGRTGTTSIVPLSGGEYARAFYESLSAADKKALARKMLDYFGNSEAEVRRGVNQFNTQQKLSFAIKEQMDGDELERTVADLIGAPADWPRVVSVRSSSREPFSASS